MRKTNFALALLTAAVLTACGGNGSTGGDQTLKNKFSAQVTFGDSLSDVGTYAVGPIAALGGGKFTINGNNTSTDPTLTGKNWTELMAAQFGLPAPCAAQTGLVGAANTDPTRNFAVAVTNHTGCYGYAQGGARVSVPYGPGNPAVDGGFAMTVPIAVQISNHLATAGGKFKGDEIVFVMGGNNDVLMALGGLSAGATAAGQAAGAQAGAAAFATSLAGQLAVGATNPAAAGPIIGLAIQTEAAKPTHTTDTIVAAAVGAAVQQGNAAAASQAVWGPIALKAGADAKTAGDAAGAKAGADFFAANAPAAVTTVGAAGAELAGLVKTRIVANGANFVVVNNMPDITVSPSAKAQPANVQDLIKNMVAAFNTQLASGLAGESKVLLVDLYSVSRDEAANPATYGLTNVTTPACGPNALGTTSLVCNATNVVAGNVSHYMFADATGHATPYEYALIAQYVAERMAVKGWL
jgi:phospholipase/lecithinase/hemolysin